MLGYCRFLGFIDRFVILPETLVKAQNNIDI